MPGYLPGVGQEWDGVVRRGAKLLHAFGEACVPRVTLVTRKAYGGAYIAMNARALGATRVFAWPGAEVAVMGAVAAVRILHRRKIAGVAADLRPQVEAELAAEHEKLAGGVEKAIEIGVVDEVVEPTATRSALAMALDVAEHGAARPPRQHPPLARSQLSCPGANSRLDDVVQPADGCTVAGMPEGLEHLVPGPTEQLVDLVDQRQVAEQPP